MVTPPLNGPYSSGSSPLGPNVHAHISISMILAVPSLHLFYMPVLVEGLLYIRFLLHRQVNAF